MIDVKRILCPIDFSPFSSHALDYAIAFARWYGSEIVLLHVYSVAPVLAGLPGVGHPTVVEPFRLTPEQHDTLLTELDFVAASAREADVPVQIELTVGAPDREILERTRATDLVIMGAHGRHGLDRLVPGSVTEHVLRQARCPVLIIPPRSPDSVPASPAMFKTILCPVDFSPASRRALDFAVSLAEENQARLFVFHALEFGAADHSERSYELSRLQPILDDARRRVREMIPEDAWTWCEPEEITTAAIAGPEIVRLARERAVEIIVMGVHGRIVDLTIFGSTTHHVITEVACPVLTLRS